MEMQRRHFILTIIGFILLTMIILAWTAAGTIAAATSDQKETKIYTECLRRGYEIVDDNCIRR